MRGWLAALLGLAFLSPARAAPPSWIDAAGLVRVSFDRRNPIYDTREKAVFTLPAGADVDWNVRDYEGRVVRWGRSHGGRVTVAPLPPGWYKLYLGHGSGCMGATCLAVFRTRPDFPPLPARGTSGGDFTQDEVVRGITGMGPQRLKIDNAADPAAAIASLSPVVALDRQYYLFHDPIRDRVLFAAFPNGTAATDGVRRIVDRFKTDIRYWEPRNEPNFGSTGAAFATREMKPFHDTVKGVDRGLRVLGPEVVGIHPDMLNWLEDFFKAGGGQSIDAFSFHAYNDLNGDVFLGRRALDAVDALLAAHGLRGMEKWQTEQGYPAALYGVYEPRLQGRWTMLQMMLYEQYHIPKEHNHLWYDRSHGFWDVPDFWENDDGSLNPAAVLMRVWSEEVYGTRFSRAMDFGETGNRLLLGDVFAGPHERLLAVMATGETHLPVHFKVSGRPAVHLVDAFGRASVVQARDGVLEVTATELPLYLEPGVGQELQELPLSWGPNLARLPGVKVTCSQPTSRLDTLVNGVFENWYWSQKPDDVPWNLQNPTFPVTIDLRLPSVQTVGSVVLYALSPWQMQGTLVSYDLQVADGNRWRTVAIGREPTNTLAARTAVTRTSLDSYFSDRSTFVNRFQPVRTDWIRLMVREATNGGAVDADMASHGGQPWQSEVMLREIEVYGR